ncbi:hypothetical protein CBS147333_9956 [Penicillium roqueforti]|nr:hypothetical protein CBS147333_9956 [Penicillium roqueforti]KAI3189198.1 hypothetical protein CBS147311_9898 [Penicillium roqueforti]KAI3261372.1 hypothetical protein CBS147308_9775 [Penicillium roqueforti]KAI3278002.1 hypothetical protein DTO003C3_9891 [Penicillium roqueforti]
MLGSWRQFAYVHLPKGMSWLDISQYRQALVLAVMLAANIVGLRLRTHSWTKAQKRAGSLAVINLIPLCTGVSFGFPADLLHVDRHMLAWFHRWVGRICVLHSLLHCLLLVSVARTTTLANPRYIVPIAAGSALVLVIPVTCAAVQRRQMQFAMKCHYILAVTAICALIYHLLERQSLYRWYLVGAICLWFSISAVVCMVAVWNQKPWKYSRDEVTMNSVSQFLWLDITLPLNRPIRPGQYVQLWMPRASFRACFQLPLFYVAFWEDGPTQRTVRMVAEPQLGLTRKLYHDALESPSRQPVIVLGPYGHPLNFYRFGTILFVVEDIGFFRALSYIEMLVQVSHKREVMVRKLEVLWKRRVGTDGYPKWVNKWIEQLFHLDRKGFCILQFSIYCLRTQSGPEENISYQKGERLWYFYGSINIKEEVARLINNQCGAVAVAVCASPSIREAVTMTVQPRAGRNLQLMIFDPDTFHARGEDEDLPDSIQSTIGDCQYPPPTVTREYKQIEQVRRFRADGKGPQSSLSEEVNMQTGGAQMGNHAK